MAQAVASRTDSLQFTLDDEATRQLVSHDPAAFTRQAPHKLRVIDEAQREPRLVLALKAAVDAD